MISKAVLAKRLDSQTAFEIVSIDIADIDVGENIGARLQADQAEADTRVARARAEGRRAMAAAEEQEKIALIEESRARLVEAEAEVPQGHGRRVSHAARWESWTTTNCATCRPIRICGARLRAREPHVPRRLNVARDEATCRVNGGMTTD